MNDRFHKLRGGRGRHGNGRSQRHRPKYTRSANARRFNTSKAYTRPLAGRVIQKSTPPLAAAQTMAMTHSRRLRGWPFPMRCTARTISAITGRLYTKECGTQRSADNVDLEVQPGQRKHQQESREHEPKSRQQAAQPPLCSDTQMNADLVQLQDRAAPASPQAVC